MKIEKQRHLLNKPDTTIKIVHVKALGVWCSGSFLASRGL